GCTEPLAQERPSARESSREVDDRCDEDSEDDDVRRVRTKLGRSRSPLVGEDDAQPDDEEDDRQGRRSLSFAGAVIAVLVGVDISSLIERNASLWMNLANHVAVRPILLRKG